MVSQRIDALELKATGSQCFDENLHFCLDVDWYCRIGRGAKIALSSRKIGHFRQHPDSKSATLQSLAKTEISTYLCQRAKKRVG